MGIFNYSTSGEDNPQSKLNEKKVRYIRKHYKRESHCKSNARELAKMMNVSNVTILQVVSYRRWGHVK